MKTRYTAECTFYFATLMSLLCFTYLSEVDAINRIMTFIRNLALVTNSCCVFDSRRVLGFLNWISRNSALNLRFRTLCAYRKLINLRFSAIFEPHDYFGPSVMAVLRRLLKWRLLLKLLTSRASAKMAFYTVATSPPFDYSYGLNVITKFILVF